ncbi:MAG TPA: 50S ribosomal protein L28 [Firmicutes bacterium]|nr:50S ribosomal protein L28 [Bacillota bacterium]
MANECEICGKRSHVGNLVSHSNIKTKKRWFPNVQRVKAIVDGAPRRIKVCTKCLKAGKVKRAI